MVVDVNVTIDRLVGFLKSLRLVSVDALCFEDSEKVFSQRIVIAVSTP